MNSSPFRRIHDKINSGELKPVDVYKFLTDANAELFDTPVIGAEVYKSVDGGLTWSKQNDEYLDAVYNSYGYYFGRIHVSPTDSDQIYIYILLLDVQPRPTSSSSIPRSMPNACCARVSLSASSH